MDFEAMLLDSFVIFAWKRHIFLKLYAKSVTIYSNMSNKINIFLFCFSKNNLGNEKNAYLQNRFVKNSDFIDSTRLTSFARPFR